MFDYHSCGKHLGVVWYTPTPCPECEKEHFADIVGMEHRIHDLEQDLLMGRRNTLNPGLPLTEHQIDRLE